MSEVSNDQPYDKLFAKISGIYNQGLQKAALAVNTHLENTYSSIGQYIVEFEQAGHSTATYGKQLLVKLSRDLTLALGKGFSRSNLHRMRQIYLEYPNCATVSHNLSWLYVDNS